MPTYDKEQETTFYKEIQNKEGLDLRDKRGKRHDLSFVLLGVIIGLLRNRDGKLSSIHRSMVNKHKMLCESLGVVIPKAVSRAQLPRILEKVDLVLFEELLFSRFELKLEEEEKQWFAGDGKELRGSIEKGEKRGEVLVQLIRHDDRAVLGQARYNGKKESEKPCLQDLIAQKEARAQKITADALHLCPAMTEPIEKSGGIFIIGLKENQKELLADMSKHAECFKATRELITIDKGHGRLEKRHYYQYDVSGEYFDHRWENTHFRSLFKVVRHRTNLKNDKHSIETAFYLSNGEIQKSDEYFEAIRNHWSVEVNNHVRDVSLQEDQLRTKKSQLLK
jgi:predicted transposase YbfD/YdcC